MQGKVGAVLAPLGFGLLAIALLGAASANAVTDAAQPSLTVPVAATTNATSSGGAAVSFIAVATDDVQPTSLICAPASGARFVAGTTTVTCTAMDAASHSTSATFAVTVLGASEQLALLRTAVIALRLAPDVQQGLLDKLDAAKQSIQASQSRIACNQLNAFANQAKAQTKKAIADGTNLLTRQNEIEAALDCVKSTAPPVLLGPRADVTTTTAPGKPTATVRFTGASSSVSCAPTSPATLAVGANTVQCSATNANGTTRTSFVVTVVDHEPPVLTLPADVTVTAPAGSSTAPVDFSVSASDNVAVRSIICDPPSGTRFAYGTTTVTCTATDTSGNTASGTFRVTVNFAISGRITDRDTTLPLAGVRAAAFDTVTGDRVNFAASGSDGRYSVVVPPGTYTVLFNGNEAVSYLPQRWNGKRVDQPGDPIALGGSVGAIDAALVPGYFVHGQVTDTSTRQVIGPPGVVVDAVDPALPCCRTISESATAPDGSYRLVLPKGSAVKLQFRADPSLRYVERWWNGRRNFNEADTLTVNADTFGIDVALIPAVLISGKVTDDRDGSGIGSVAVVITDSTTRCCPFGGITVASTASDGTYSLMVPKGVPVKIQFVPFGSADRHFMGEWFNDQPSWDDATIRSFTADTTGINAGLSRGSFISGHVARQDGTAIGGLYANANDGLAGCCHFITGSRTDASGNYHILVRPGSYKVLFFSRPGFLADDGVTYIDQWWNGAPSFEQGTQVAVSTADVDGINAVMNRAVIVSGHVTDATGQIPVAGFQVNALDAAGQCCQFVGGAQTDANGDYNIAVPPGVTVKVDFGVFSGPPPGTRYLPQWWNNKTSFDAADPILAAADVPNINARLANGFLITGHVSERGSGAALEGMHVQVFDPAVPCCPFREIAHTETSATGDYAVVLAAGSYKVQFSEFPQPAVRPHLTQWWQNKPFDQGADLLVVAGDRTGIDATLPVGVLISGSVTAAGGTVPVVGLNVSAQDASQPCCHFVGGAQTDASGNYRFPVPAGSSVKVEFGVFSGPPPGTRYLGQWWNNKPDFGAATTINALSDASGINADLASGFVLSGHVSDASGTTPLGGIGVNANDATMGCCQFIVGTQTDAAGNYRLIVPAGRVIRVFFGTNPAGGVRYLPQWWNGKPFFDQADDIAMTQDRPGVDAHLALGVLIHGRVTDSTGAIPVVGLNVSAHDATQGCCQFVGGSQTDFDGQYAMVVPSGHDVKIEFGVFGGPPPGTRYLGEWWDNAATFDTATPVSTATDQNGIDAQLEQGFVISGMVRAPGGAGVPNAFVGASIGQTSQCCTGVGGANTDPTGHYRLVLRAGIYRINVNLPPERHFVSQWWAGVPGGTAYFQRATDIILGPDDAPNRDFDLQAGSVISGHVSDAVSGAALGGVGVTANDAGVPCCEGVAFGGTDGAGNYALVVPSGRPVRVFFGPPLPHILQWWDNKPSFEQADNIDTTADRPGTDARLATGFRITGHVSDRSTGAALANVNVEVIDPRFPCCPFHDAGGANTDASGNYLAIVPAGTYKIAFYPPPGSHYVAELWRDVPTYDLAESLTVNADTSNIDAHLAPAVFIDGRVTDELTGAPIQGIVAQAMLLTPTCCTGIAGANTDADGRYRLIVPAGTYKLFFGQGIAARAYAAEWWDNRPSFDTADPRLVNADAVVDVQLAPGLFVRGHVTDTAGNPIRGAGVSAYDASVACCLFVGGSGTDQNGDYALSLRPGSYKIQFFPPPGTPFQSQFWNGKPPQFELADTLLLSGDVSAINAQLAGGFSIRGNVSDRANHIAIANIDVQAYDALVPCCRFLGGTRTNQFGDYTLPLPSAATVKLTFQAIDLTAPAYVQRWWNDKADFGPADPIVVTGNVTDINELMDAGYKITGRVTDSANPTVGVPDVFVAAQPNGGCCFYGTKTMADGRYIVVVSAATYRISFFSPVGSDFLEQWWNDKLGYATADLVTVPSTTVDLSAISAALVHGIPVAGSVTDSSTGAAVAGVGVVADRDDPPTSCCLSYQARTGADGRYTMYVSAGTYRVNFQPPNTTDYVIEYWDQKPNRDSADLLTVTGPTSGIDARLDRGFRISGRVTDAATSDPLSFSVVTINPLGCCQAFTIVGTAPDGTYSVLVRAGSYKIGFNPPYGTDFVPQYWDGRPDLASADTLVVNGPRPNIDAALAHPSASSGPPSDGTPPAGSGP